MQRIHIRNFDNSPQYLSLTSKPFFTVYHTDRGNSEAGSANLCLTMKVATTSATLSGTSSCTACPQAGSTCIWNFPAAHKAVNYRRLAFNKKNVRESRGAPCIWPTVNSRSNLSTPASSNIFGAATLRNADERPLNHPDQYCSVFARSILHVYFLLSGVLQCTGGGILAVSSSWITSSRWAIGSSAWLSHWGFELFSNSSISWVASLSLSILWNKAVNQNEWKQAEPKILLLWI